MSAEGVVIVAPAAHRLGVGVGGAGTRHITHIHVRALSRDRRARVSGVASLSTWFLLPRRGGRVNSFNNPNLHQSQNPTPRKTHMRATRDRLSGQIQEIQRHLPETYRKHAPSRQSAGAPTATCPTITMPRQYTRMEVRRLVEREQQAIMLHFNVPTPLTPPPGRGWVNHHGVAHVVEQLISLDCMAAHPADVLAELHPGEGDCRVVDMPDGAHAFCFRTGGVAEDGGPLLVCFKTAPGAGAAPVACHFENELGLVAAVVRRRQERAIHDVARNQVYIRAHHYPHLFADNTKVEGSLQPGICWQGVTLARSCGRASLT